MARRELSPSPQSNRPKAIASNNEKIREGIKEYSSWPTIPQLYVSGEFQGGCDIVTEMYQSGELQQKLRSLG